MDNKITYLNQYLDAKQLNYYNGPKTLFKYRPFDKFSFDMIENDYIYLCPAEKLDDETECITSLELQNLYDLEGDGLTRQCVDLIVDMIKPYTSCDTFEVIKRKIYEIMKIDHTVNPRAMLEFSLDIQEVAPNVNIANLVNWIVNIPEKIKDSTVNSNLRKLIVLAMNARKAIGVCSLCESNEVEDMWVNYAKNMTGYCIEYDMTEYEYGLVFPVVYNDERQTNIVINLVNAFIGESIQGMSSNQIKADKTQYLCLFLSKYKKWEYQKEWRILGDANERLKAPKIKTIYLGKNVSRENEEKIIKLSNQYNFNIVKMKG